MNKTITFYDKTYEIVKENGCYSCKECAFYLDNSITCNSDQSDLCCEEDAIFVEVQDVVQAKEQKYTIQELIDKLNDLNFSIGGLPRLIVLEQQAQLKKDPEYEEFTRLKEKFKDVI